MCAAPYEAGRIAICDTLRTPHHHQPSNAAPWRWGVCVLCWSRRPQVWTLNLSYSLLLHTTIPTSSHHLSISSLVPLSLCLSLLFSIPLYPGSFELSALRLRELARCTIPLRHLPKDSCDDNAVLTKADSELDFSDSYDLDRLAPIGSSSEHTYPRIRPS